MDKYQIDKGKNSNENTTDIKASFSCEQCGKTFNSREELKEHSSKAHEGHYRYEDTKER